MKGFGWNHRTDSILNHEENIWPSFTDIMMLIAMIFLLATLVLTSRNWQLADRLESALQSEENLSQENLDKETQNKRLLRTIQGLERQLSHQQSKVFQRQQDIASLELQLQKKGNLLTEHERSLASAQLMMEDLQDKQRQQNKLLEQLQETLSRRDSQLARIQVKLDESRQSQQDLNRRYQKLLRPARSSKNKFVVEVHYENSPPDSQVYLKLPGGSRYPVSMEQLHKDLASYQKRDPSKLYLKIVFPKGDQVSHKDAWLFTNGLLEQYDYYYQ